MIANLSKPILNGANVLTIDRDEMIDVALQTMVKNNVSALPVVSTGGKKFYGFVDLSDLVNFICHHFANYTFTSFAEFDSVYKEVRKFHNTTVREMLASQWANRSSTHTVQSGFTLFHAFEMLSRGYHRVAITGPNNEIISLITQVFKLLLILK